MSLKQMVFGGIFVMIFISSHVQSEVYPTSGWLWATPEEVGMDDAKLKQARDYALTGGGSGCIIRGGRMVMAWGDQTKKYDLKSTTKSIGVTALGLAIKDGKMRLSDQAKQYHFSLGIPPESNADTGWIDEITILHLATQTAGFDKPGGYTELIFAPGTKWAYTDGGTNWLAECITLAYQQDLKTLMFNRVFTPLGIEPKDLTWRNNAYREDTINGIKRREFGSGIHANVNAMARIGYLYLRGGRWDGQEIIPPNFVDTAAAPVSDVLGLPVVNDAKNRFAGASNHYGLLWWNNSPHWVGKELHGAIPDKLNPNPTRGNGTLTNVPRDAYWSWGLHDSFIIVIPSLDIVVARAGSDWQGQRSPHSYNILKPFLEPIANSVSAGTPYPTSPVITSLTWEPAETVIRKAEGSDNWPITWADDSDLYTAYGDGWGFNSDHSREKKLSLGIAKIAGVPPQFSGVNIPSSSIESKGGGRSGKKASGILMVDGILYLWARNANLRGEQSQLAWSEDHGRTWVWSDWKFEELGYPCFLNFGLDYAQARDEYVYVYSPNTSSAYHETDEIILARSHKNEITNRESYQFFERLEQSGPVWTKEISQRGAVFSFPGGCNRIDVTYNAPLGRYLMTLRSRAQSGGRNQFSIYDAPEPWGPWTTVYYTEQWEGEPLSTSNGGWGESQHIPSKWISADGKTFYLVFSGDDAFAVRKATLTVARAATRNNKNLGHIGNFSKWGKIEIAFAGPDSKGRGDPNPFSILLDVVFTGPGGQTFQVPGFYDGDGKGALDGNRWKVRFSADEAGTWRFVSKSSDLPLNGYTGFFTVVPPAKNAPDFYRWGRLEYIGTAANKIRYLKFRDGPYWLKAGCDDPENFLGKFRNYNTLEKRKRAVDYLAARGVNSLYIITHNVEGDHQDVWPWLGKSPQEVKANASTDVRFDIIKLDKWRQLFEYMQTKGVVPYIVLEDDSAWTGYDHPRYYREMVARFGYLPALMFNFNEEYNENYRLSEALSYMQQLKKIDPYHHPVGIHNVNSPNDEYIDAPQVDFTSIQTGGNDPLKHNKFAIDWINRCKSRNKRILMVGFDEGRPEQDRRGWWSAYIGGGVWEVHVQKPYDRPMSAWEPTWTELGGARAFMESLPFWEMEPNNRLVKSGAAFCLAKQGVAYALYLPSGGKVTIQLSSNGTYEYAWWKATNGKTGSFQNKGRVGGGRQKFTAPGSGDWALRIISSTLLK